MKRCGKILIGSLALFLTVIPAAGQNISFQSKLVKKRLELFCQVNPFEDVYIHTDRRAYAAGETVFFRAYLVSHPALKLSSKDSYLYVQVMSNSGQTVSASTVQILRGTGDGSLLLPDTLSSGTYTLRAYTGMMSNFLPDGCFMTVIRVVNPSSPTTPGLFSSEGRQSGPPASVTFMPEGGFLVAGVENRAGILALDRYGQPAQCRGQVMTTEADTVCSVFCDSTGITEFSIVPEESMEYLFVTEDGSRFPLHFAFGETVALSAKGNPDGTLTITLRPGTDRKGNSEAGMLLLVQQRGKVLFTRELDHPETTVTITVGPDKTARGINDIVLFNGEGKVLAERYIYLDRSSTRTIAISALSAAPRSSMTVSASLNGAGCISSSLSVSDVANGSSVMTAAEYLSLGAEIILPVNMPWLRDQFPWLDNRTRNILLMGATSSRLKWDRIMSGNFRSPLYGEENGGRLLYIEQRSPAGINPAGERHAYLTAFGMAPSFQYSVADSTGRFVFFLENSGMISDIAITTDSAAGGQPVRIGSAFSEEYVGSGFDCDTVLHPLPADMLRLLFRYQVRKNYGITDVVQPSGEEVPGRPAARFYGMADQEIRLDDYISLASVREIFFELIKDISVRTGRKDEGPVIWNNILKREPALFIDQVPVYDASVVLDLNPAHIRQIDVVYGDYRVGDLIFPGLVNVSTRNGNFTDLRSSSWNIRMPWRMYDRPAVFLAPDYSDQAARSSREPDFRNTMFWGTGKVTDDKENVSCRFFTSDDAGTFEAVMTVVNSQGEIMSAREHLSFPGNL